MWIARGPLFDAIRASISIPGVFRPHPYLGKTLVDGGLLNPVPIAPTFRDFTDLTIAVNLNGQTRLIDTDHDLVETPVDEVETATDSRYELRVRQFLDALGVDLGRRDEDKLGVFELMTRSFETMQNAIAAVKLAAYRPDVVIEVPRDTCAAHEFHRARELIEIGYALAQSAMAEDR